MKIMNVPVIICLGIIFLFANQAWAAEWIYYTSNASGKSYYDKSSIKKVNKNIVSVGTKIIFNQNGKTRAFLFLKSINKAPDNPDLLELELRLQEIDCVNKKKQDFFYKFLYKKGNVIFSFPKDVSGEWQKIIPKSTSEILKNKVCSAGNTSKTKKK